MAEDNFRYIVRVANTDLDGKKPVLYGLTKIRGIGVSFSNLITTKAGLSGREKLGELDDAAVKKLNDAVDDLVKTAPGWMKNRPRDPENGGDNHLLTADLKFQQENDIRNMRKLKTYRGARHAAKLPVRGQRTKSNFRSNKGKALGVKKAKK